MRWRSFVERPDEVVVLEVPLKGDLMVGIGSLPVHSVAEPLPLVVGLIGPGVAPLALSVTSFEMPLVFVPVGKQVDT